MKGLVSVIMGVHDENDEYLKLAIKSVCQQSYANFEYIIIDDLSCNHTKKLLEDIAASDKRIRLYRNESNIGLTKSLNRGLSLAKGDYIARMDADDFSTKERFKKQVSFLEKNPDVDLLGGGVVSFGDKITFFSPAFGYTNEQAQCDLFFQSTLCHPSVMIRKSFLEMYGLTYDENVKKGQDYDMWERCSVYGKLAVMEDVVLYYRIHGLQITSTNRSEQERTACMVRMRRLNRIGLIPSDEEYKCHMMLLGMVDKTIDSNKVKIWMKKILEANRLNPIVDDKTLRKSLFNRFALYKARNGKNIIECLPTLIKVSISRIRMRIKIMYIATLIKKII